MHIFTNIIYFSSLFTFLHYLLFFFFQLKEWTLVFSSFPKRFQKYLIVIPKNYKRRKRRWWANKLLIGHLFVLHIKNLNFVFRKICTCILQNQWQYVYSIETVDLCRHMSYCASSLGYSKTTVMKVKNFWFFIPNLKF